MDLLDRLASGLIGVDLVHSNSEDIRELSKVIDCAHPELAQDARGCDGFRYGTMSEFLEDYGRDELCFYNFEVKTWDGYKRLDKNQFKKEDRLTADEILRDYTPVEVEDSEILELING